MVVDGSRRGGHALAELGGQRGARLAPPSQSSRSVTHASASRARSTVGPTAPSATRMLRVGRSTARQALAMEMTMALRTPTFVKPWYPSSTGHRDRHDQLAGLQGRPLDPGEQVVDGDVPRTRRPGDGDDGVERGEDRERVAGR